MNLLELAKKAKEQAAAQAPTAAKLSLNLGAKAATPAAPAAPAKPAASEFGGLDIMSLDLGDVASVREEESVIEFSDHVPVDKPLRELPAELNEQQQNFIQLLDGVYALHHDPDAIKSATARIMIDMRNTPYLADLVMDEDVTMIVRKMKEIQGYKKVKETKARTSRATSKKKAADDAMAALLSSEFAGIKL